MPKKVERDASGRFVKGPSQGQPKGPSQGHTSDASASDAGRAPSAASRKSRRSARKSDAQSESEAESVGGRVIPSPEVLEALAEPLVGALWAPPGRRRQRCELSPSPSVSSTEGELMGPPPPKVFIDRRAEFRKAELKKVGVEQTVEEMVRELDASIKSAGAVGEQPADILLVQAQKCLHINREVAARSGSLKGGFVKGLNLTTRVFADIVEALASRSSTSEVAVLKAENVRLRKEVAGLRSAVEMLRVEMAKGREPPILSPPSPTPAPRRASPMLSEPVPPTALSQEEFARGIMVQIGTMVNTRLKEVEHRLLPEERLAPPLAARQKVAAAAATPKPKPGPSSASAPAVAAPRREQQVKGKGKGRGKGKAAPAAAPVPAPRPLPPAPKAMNRPWSAVSGEGAPKAASQTVPTPAAPAPEAGWTVVGKRGGKRTATATTATKQVKLQAPRSAAVVISLQPAAEESGVSYADVLGQARRAVDLASIGITEGLRSRKAATGARMLEVPGANSGEKADSLAAKLREVLDPAMVRISRPVKTAEMRISGLDDSVTSADVVAAVVKRTGCTEQSVHVGEVRRGYRGLGSAYVRCPVTAAKQLATGGRLLVGWVSAQVTVLEGRPMRCYKCLHTGHVRVQCDCEVDRSDECYRCGQKGHIAAKCPAPAPNCSLCAAAGKPSAHRMGGKQCHPPKPKRRTGAAAHIPAARSPPRVVEDMETAGD